MVAVSSASHYFDADPSAPERRRTVRTRLAGRDVEVQTANGIFSPDGLDTVSYTHLTLPTIAAECRSRWSPYH